MSDITAIPSIISDVIQSQRALHPDRPVLIGVAGAQGSGKTTAVRRLAAGNPHYAHFSIDDVYLDRAQRALLAARTHPLFVTRGPPGTHDISLARATIEALIHANVETETALPRFDKIKDSMRPRQEWPVFRGAPRAILVDGWCIGATPPEPGPNEVEREDAKGVWRAAQDAFLHGAYADWFATFDAIVYLKPPNWEVVRHWRGEQEVTLRGRALTPEEETWIDRFIMHYERITRSMMAGRHTANVVVELNEGRNVVARRAAETDVV